MKYFRLKAGTCKSSKSSAGGSGGGEGGGSSGAAAAAASVSKSASVVQFVSIVLKTLFGLDRQSATNNSSSTPHEERHVAGEAAGGGVPVPRVQVCPCVTMFDYLLQSCFHIVF